jgi:opacity protein-like surface antigen
MRSLLIIFAVALFIILSVDTVFAQTENGDIELSGAASFMSRKFEDAEEAWWVINLATRLGIFVTRTIEIEPEIMFSKYKEEDLGYALSGNLVFNISSRSPDNDIVPFFLGGFGVSNTIQFLPNILWFGSEDNTWTILNLGAGFKLFISKQVALRLEYRFQNYFEEENITYHNIFFGISAFFK